MQKYKELISAGFKRICGMNELQEGAGKRVIINDIEAAVFKIKGKVHAISNVCPHQHTKMIYDGFIEDDCVVCPLHGWKFNLETGKMPTGRSGLDVYEVEISEESVYVKVYKKELKW